MRYRIGLEHGILCTGLQCHTSLIFGVVNCYIDLTRFTQKMMRAVIAQLRLSFKKLP